jgi:hypothetical protein
VRLLPWRQPSQSGDAAAAAAAQRAHWLRASRGDRLAVLHAPADSAEAEALCRLAARNGEALGSGRRGGCAPPPPLAAALSGSDGAGQAEQCAALAAAAPSTFFWVTGGLPAQPHWDSRVLYVLALPSPLPRALRVAVAAAGPAGGSRVLAEHLRACNASAACENNPLVRYLLGPGSAPAGALSDAHLGEARARLSQFDALLLPPPCAEGEGASGTASAPRGLQAGVLPAAAALGWRFWDVTGGDRRSGAVHASARDEADADALRALAAEAALQPGSDADAALRLLRAAGELDAALLAEARRLYLAPARARARSRCGEITMAGSVGA